MILEHENSVKGRTIRKVITGGTVYILQEFVFHVHCFRCPLHDFFCLFLEGGYSTVTIILLMAMLERASNESFFISVSHSRFALLETFTNEFFGQHREPQKIA